MRQSNDREGNESLNFEDYICHVVSQIVSIINKLDIKTVQSKMKLIPHSNIINYIGFVWLSKKCL